MEKEKERDKEFNYEELCFFDVLGPIRHLLDRGIYWISKEGLIESRTSISHESPWLFGARPDDRRCRFWGAVIFPFYGFVPKGCHNCWKVVGHPKNLEEAIEVWKFQKKLGLPSKTGMEQRNYSGHLSGWSSFWYAPLGGGLEGGRRFFESIKRALRKEFGSGAMKIGLKKGCTEMEQKAGPTDQWEYRIDHEIKEKLIEAAYAPTIDAEVPLMLEVSIKRQWIEWAATHGDMSYLKYTNGKIFRSPVWYEESVHSPKDHGPVLSFDGNEKKGEEDDGETRNNRHECDKCEGSCEGCSNNGGRGKLVLV